MGIPLAFFAFGDEGLALAVAAFSVHSVAQFTVGISIHAGGVHSKQLIRTPVLWGVFILSTVYVYPNCFAGLGN